MTDALKDAIASELEAQRRRGRRRLIGAIVIVAALAAFLPMVFDQAPQRDSDRVSLTIPSRSNPPPFSPGKPGTDASTSDKTASKKAPDKAPVGSAGPQQPAQPSASIEPPKTPVTASQDVEKRPAEPLKTPAKAESIAKAEPIAKSEQRSSAPAATDSAPRVESKAASAAAPDASSRFAIQIGVFSDAANAKSVIAKLDVAKLKTTQESVSLAAGSATRVRAGPFATRTEADAALEKIKAAGLQGQIVVVPQ